MAATFLTALVSFVSTNIDDIFVLMILYAQVQDKKGIIQIIAGQYLGIGFLPLFLGIKSWISYRRTGTADQSEMKEQKQISFISVALLTVANGADNYHSCKKLYL